MRMERLSFSEVKGDRIEAKPLTNATTEFSTSSKIW